jgi:hypothetical protein
MQEFQSNPKERSQPNAMPNNPTIYSRKRCRGQVSMCSEHLVMLSAIVIQLQSAKTMSAHNFLHHQSSVVSPTPLYKHCFTDGTVLVAVVRNALPVLGRS